MPAARRVTQQRHDTRWRRNGYVYLRETCSDNTRWKCEHTGADVTEAAPGVFPLSRVPENVGMWGHRWGDTCGRRMSWEWNTSCKLLNRASWGWFCTDCYRPPSEWPSHTQLLQFGRAAEQADLLPLSPEESIQQNPRFILLDSSLSLISPVHLQPHSS